MIAINIRGTGGSGKSTLVKRVMELYPHRSSVITDGRKRPVGYELRVEPKVNALYVPGHYETACGGCDTIKTVDAVYADVRAYLRTVPVLYEGIMVQDDVRRAVELDKWLRTTTAPGSGDRAHGDLRPEDDWKLHVIRLSTPIEDCLAAIRERRAQAAAAKGKEVEPLNEKNTRQRYERQLGVCRRLKDSGVSVEVLDREAALARCRELLGV